MKIYALTPLGKRLARSTNNPDTAGWKIVHHLDGVGRGTPDQIASFIGISEEEVATTLSTLKRKKPAIVQELSGGNLQWDF